jgi:uncharacterized membrane protein
VTHHGHQHAAFRVGHRTRRILYGVTGALAALTVAGLVVLWPSGRDVSAPEALGLTSKIYDAAVVDATVDRCSYATADVPDQCREVNIRMEQGPDKGLVVHQEFPVDQASSPKLSAGDRVVMAVAPSVDPQTRYSYTDRQRRTPLVFLLGIFVVAVVLLGRLRGFMALIGLGLSLVVLLIFTIPAILEGRSAVLVALITASAIAYLALYLAGGFNDATTVALIGTLGALALTTVLGIAFFALCQFSGYTSDEAFFVTLANHSVNLRGLLLGGVMIGALGALDDITVTQASAVWELHAANPTLGVQDLFESGLRIGRDHVASTVNTLLLAYAGASMPLLLLFTVSHQSLGAVANSEVVALEIVRTLVGSVGLVCAVPITTWLAAVVVGSRARPRPSARSVEPVSGLAAARD